MEKCPVMCVESLAYDILFFYQLMGKQTYFHNSIKLFYFIITNIVMTLELNLKLIEKEI